MGVQSRAPQSGFSFLELVVSMVLMSVLLTTGIERLMLTKAQAERAAIDQVTGSVRSAITIRLADLLVRGRSAEAVALTGTNPMLLLAERPHNYLGELFGPAASALQPGNWYFDSRAGQLCYLVESVDYFESPLGPRACFRIEPVYEDVNGNGRLDADELRGMRLAARAFRWKPKTGIVQPPSSSGAGKPGSG